MVVDGFQQEFGLAAEPVVDGTRSDACTAGNLSYTGFFVAFLGEHLGRCVQETVSQFVRLVRSGHVADNNGYSRSVKETPESSAT